jgi:hypothetical protein
MNQTANGRILLIDIPKYQARLDAAIYPVEGGFRGFQEVLSGWHSIGVRTAPETDAPELRIETLISAENPVVLIGRVDDRLEHVEDSARLAAARSGAMDRALIATSRLGIGPTWQTATGRITLPRRRGPAPLDGAGKRILNFKEALRTDEEALRFAQELFAAVVQQEAEALNHLQDFWSALGSAGSAIGDSKEFFAAIGEIISSQLKLAPSLRAVAQETRLNHFADDLADDGGPAGQAASLKLQAVLHAV